MEAIGSTGTGAMPASVDVCRTSTEPVSLSAERIYHDYAPRVFRVARGMVRSDADAEDVMQDVLLKVICKLPSFRGEASLPTWLHRVTINTALSHRRKWAVREERRATKPFDLVMADEPGREAAPTPEAQLINRESRGLIERAIAALPSIYRAVFLLADVDELPNAVIAERLSLSLPAIKSRLHRARQMLREALAPHFGDAPEERRA